MKKRNNEGFPIKEIWKRMPRFFRVYYIFFGIIGTLFVVLSLIALIKYVIT